MDLRLAPGDWRTMDGRPSNEHLAMEPVGPPLSTGRKGWVAVSGWRQVASEPARVWTVAMVRESILGGHR